MFRRIPNLLARSAAFAAMLLFASAPVAAGSAPADKAAAEAKARDYFSNVELVDQNGRSLKFYDEVLKDNIVVISFIFTNCQSACPLMTRNLTMIRDMLREDERHAIQFVSISIDPLRDTPSAMKEFAQKHDADNERLAVAHRPAGRRQLRHQAARLLHRRPGNAYHDPARGERAATRTGPRSSPTFRPTGSSHDCGCLSRKMRHRDLRNGAVAAKRTTRQAAAAPLVSVLALAGMLLFAPGPSLFAADLTEAEERGKYIYETGRSRSRRVIMASIQGGEPTPGHILPCINCHGADGRGAEDYVGVAPLNINWYALAYVGPARARRAQPRGRSTKCRSRAPSSSAWTPTATRWKRPCRATTWRKRTSRT